MSESYFDIPFFRSLTSSNGWDRQNSLGTHFHVARAFFLLKSTHLSGPAKIGKKFDVLGKPEGIISQRKKTLKVETEVFQHVETIEKSMVESETITRIFDELTGSFGDGKVFKAGGKCKEEQSLKLKSVFETEFKITNSQKRHVVVEYEFKDTVPKDFKDRVCGVETYQRCSAVLYLIQIDFLNVMYERKFWGLRKKIRKNPFPEKHRYGHPNVIKLGIPLAAIEYWAPLPLSSLIIKDSDYSPEVLDDSEMTITSPDITTKDRPYWTVPKGPSLYQLANVAFPAKWINLKNLDYSKEQLMQIELGEAEQTTWWFMHGPGKVLG